MREAVLLALTLLVGLASFLATRRWQERARRRAERDLEVAAPLPEDETLRAAVHEAGHAIAAWFSPIVQVLWVTIENPRGGQIQYVIDKSDEARALWARAVISLAGIAAELSVYPTARTGPSEGDLRDAREAAHQLMVRAQTVPPWADQGAWRSFHFPFEQAYRPPLAPEEKKVLQLCYAKARQLVRDHHVARNRLTGHLLYRRTLTAPDLERMFGTRAFVRVMKVFRPTVFVA